jgi:hypothetical protein
LKRKEPAGGQTPTGSKQARFEKHTYLPIKTVTNVHEKILPAGDIMPKSARMSPF